MNVIKKTSEYELIIKKSRFISYLYFVKSVDEVNNYLNDLKIKSFAIPHDAVNPCGFNISNNEKNISIATDIGHMTKEILKVLEPSDFVLLESNYDPEVLKCSPYPYILSKESNFPELAYKTVLDEVIAGNCKEDSLNLSVASRDIPGKLIKI